VQVVAGAVVGQADIQFLLVLEALGVAVLAQPAVLELLELLIRVVVAVVVELY
jgi:hypothetical protein